jgi:hypothetical protein
MLSAVSEAPSLAKKDDFNQAEMPSLFPTTIAGTPIAGSIRNRLRLIAMAAALWGQAGTFIPDSLPCQDGLKYNRENSDVDVYRTVVEEGRTLLNTKLKREHTAFAHV